MGLLGCCNLVDRRVLRINAEERMLEERESERVGCSEGILSLNRTRRYAECGIKRQAPPRSAQISDRLRATGYERRR